MLNITQAALAEMLDTPKSAISRIENHADDVKLSTLERFTSAFQLVGGPNHQIRYLQLPKILLYRFSEIAQPSH
jgi:predicted transcriptional regulator